MFRKILQQWITFLNSKTAIKYGFVVFEHIHHPLLCICWIISEGKRRSLRCLIVDASRYFPIFRIMNQLKVRLIVGTSPLSGISFKVRRRLTKFFQLESLKREGRKTSQLKNHESNRCWYVSSSISASDWEKPIHHLDEDLLRSDRLVMRNTLVYVSVGEKIHLNSVLGD